MTFSHVCAHVARDHKEVHTTQILADGVVVRCSTCNQMLEVHMENNLPITRENAFMTSVLGELAEWHTQH